LPILPQYVVSLGGTASQVGLVIGTLTLMSVIIRPYFGRAVDKYGRKKFMLFGAGLFALLFSIYGQIHAVIPLCFVRVAHGVAHGSYLAAAYAYVADLAPPDRRGEVMGVYGVANVVAMALFPALGGAIISRTGSFPTLFILSTAIATGGFVSVFFLSEIRAEGKKDGGKAGPASPIKRRAVLVASLALFSAAALYGSVVTFLPVYAPARGLRNVGIFFSTYAVFTLISRLIAGKLSDRFGRRKIILPFLVIVAMAAFMLPFLRDLYLLVLIGAFFGLGFGAFMPALNAYVVDETPLQQRAGALAFFTAFMDIGITTGALVLGVVGQYWGYETMFFIGGVVVVAGITLFAISGRASPAGAG
jgi:MFS family permease